jgi:hypothetical protein
MNISEIARNIADTILQDGVVDEKSWDELRRTISLKVHEKGVPDDFTLEYLSTDTESTRDVMEQFYVTHHTHPQKFTVNIWNNNQITLYDVPERQPCCMVVQ